MKRSLLFRLIAFVMPLSLLLSCSTDPAEEEGGGKDPGDYSYCSLEDFNADGSFIPNSSSWYIDNDGALTKDNAANLLAAINNYSGDLDISFPDITSIDDELFKGCDNIFSISIPKVTKLGDSTFEDSALQSIYANEVTTVGDRVFANCEIMSIDLPMAYSFGVEIFDGCTSLYYLYLTCDKDFSITGETFSGFDGSYTKLDLSISKLQYPTYIQGDRDYSEEFEPTEPSVAIDNRMWCGQEWAIICGTDERVGYMLEDFSNLEFLVPDDSYPWFIMDESVTEAKCDGLITALDNCAIAHQGEWLGARVTLFFVNATSIGDGALEQGTYDNLDALSRVIAPNVVSIGASAFKDCPSLEYIDFASATSIGAYAFSGISELFETRFESEQNISVDENAFAGTRLYNLYVNDNKFTTSTPLVDDDNRTWAGSVWESGVNDKTAYVGLYLSEVSELGDDLGGNYYMIRDGGIITQGALEPFLERLVESNVLMSLYFPYATEFGEYAFDLGYSSECVNEINAPNVTKLGKGTFKNNARLYGYNLPLVTELADEVLFGTDIANFVEKLGGDESCIFGTITSIGNSAFESSDLYHMAFSEAKSVGDRAFADCSNLDNISFDEANIFGSEIASGSDAINDVWIVTEGDITLESDTFSGFDTKRCTLTLHPDKSPDDYFIYGMAKSKSSDDSVDVGEDDSAFVDPFTTAYPQASGNTWGGFEWEEIYYYAEGY